MQRGHARKSQIIIACALLAAVTLALYWPVTRCEFVSYDDQVYVTENPHVLAGVTCEGIGWAFGRLHGEETYWHPLTWVSHMVDCQVFGLNAAAHHLVNLLLHTVNTVLLFLVFWRLTGAFWRCAAMAALFALHPLQVDTVAWVAERKNLLGALFWLLTMGAYTLYAEKSRVGSAVAEQRAGGNTACFLFYGLALATFALGLMCKPVLVTLPFVLLLIDYWPLRRLPLPNSKAGRFAVGRLVWEKAPFFLLAGTSAVITVMGHRGMGALRSAASLPWDARLENALVSYFRYLGKMVWPSHLAVLYPYSKGWPVAVVVGCSLVLIAISLLTLRSARTRPYLLVGWFWFLGVMVPFIGLIQAGEQAMADRFMYVPIIGLAIIAAWGACDALGARKDGPLALGVGGALVLGACAVVTSRQLEVWRDTETLFRHAVAVTSGNYLAYSNLGVSVAAKGRAEEAVEYFNKALAISPECPEALTALGNVLSGQEKNAEAIQCYESALRAQPNYAQAYNNLGIVLIKTGKNSEAIGQIEIALRLQPTLIEGHLNLGIALVSAGRAAEGMQEYQAALALWPNYPEAHNNLALALCDAGNPAQAIPHFQAALKVWPDRALTRLALADALAQTGRLEEAVAEYTQALDGLPGNAEVHYRLALALEHLGRNTEAAAHYSEALRLGTDHPDARHRLESLPGNAKL